MGVITGQIAFKAHFCLFLSIDLHKVIFCMFLWKICFNALLLIVLIHYLCVEVVS